MGKKPKPVERIKKKIHPLFAIQDSPCESDDPRGYKKFYCDQQINVKDALNKIGMTIDKVGYFNFGNDFEGYGIDNYEELFVFFGTTYLKWKKDPGFLGLMFEGFDGLTGEGGAWFWVPGDCKLDPDPDPNGAYFDEYKNPSEDKKAIQEEKDKEELRKVPPFKNKVLLPIS